MKNFKVKYDAKKAAKNFKKKFTKFQKSDEWKKDAAEVVIKNIKGSTRLQKFIKDGGALKKIKTETEKDKKRWKKKNSKGKSYGDKKSNLTRSGQLLESLNRKKDRKRVIVEPTGKRTPYSGQKKAPTNKQLTEYLREKGFVFLGLSEKMKKIIRNKLISQIRRSILKK